MVPHLISIDWGSTNCRVSLLSAKGVVLEQRGGWPGIINNLGGDFTKQLREMVAPWRAENGELPVIISGMAGSRNGLVEVAYVDCPTDMANLASQLWHLDPEILPACWLVPGLHSTTLQGSPEVMRGEEVQLFGLLEVRDRMPGTWLTILPGTHSKWVLVEDGTISHFATAISGELFATLCQHGTLAALVGNASAPEPDHESFRGGVANASRPGGLLHHLFNLRAGALLGEFPQDELLSRLSGLIIGHELEAMLTMFPETKHVAVVGEGVLAQLYCEALAIHDMEASVTDGHVATAAGAARLASAAGILGGA